MENCINGSLVDILLEIKIITFKFKRVFHFIETLVFYVLLFLLQYIFLLNHFRIIFVDNIK